VPYTDLLGTWGLLANLRRLSFRPAKSLRGHTFKFLNHLNVILAFGANRRRQRQRIESSLETADAVCTQVCAAFQIGMIR
jgi:hypothetical protein